MFARPSVQPDFFGGFEKGFDLGNKMIEGMANRRAGREIAGGNVQAGMNEMLKVGNISGVQDYQKTAQDMQLAGNTDRRADIYTGINQDINTRAGVTHDRTIADEDADKALTFLSDTTEMLGNVFKQTGPEGTVQAFDSIVPVLQMRGNTPEQINTYRQGLVENPEQFINMLKLKTDEEKKKYLLGPGSKLTDATGNIIASAPFAPKIATAGEGQRLFLYDPAQSTNTSSGFQDPSTPSAAPSNTPQERFLDFYTQHLGPVEGGFTEADGRSGAPANFGVNQAANPDIDVASLTPEEAQQVLYERYYLRSGADRLPEPVSSIHADTAINAGVETANRMLQKSGGDPAAYMALRDEYYKSLGQPENEAGWSRRQQSLKQYTSQFGSPATSGTPSLPLVAEGPPKPVDSFVPLTPEEKASLNIPESVVAQRNTRTNKIETIYTPPSGSNLSGPLKLSVQDNVFLSGKRQAYSARLANSDLLDEFMALNKIEPTGDAYALEMVAAFKAATDEEFGRMRSITSFMTPSMRQGLPGAASNFDVQMFQNSTLNVKNKRETNERTFRAFKRQEKRDGDYLEFMEAYAADKGNLLGAQEMWNNYVEAYPILDKRSTQDNLRLNPAMKPWREAIPGFGKDNASMPTYNVTTGEWE